MAKKPQHQVVQVTNYELGILGGFMAFVWSLLVFAFINIIGILIYFKNLENDPGLFLALTLGFAVIFALGFYYGYMVDPPKKDKIIHVIK